VHVEASETPRNLPKLLLPCGCSTHSPPQLEEWSAQRGGVRVPVFCVCLLRDVSWCVQDGSCWWRRERRRPASSFRLVDAGPKGTHWPPCRATAPTARIRCRRGRSCRNRGDNTNKLRLGRRRRGSATVRPVRDAGDQGASAPRLPCSYIVRHGVCVQPLILAARLHARAASASPRHFLQP